MATAGTLCTRSCNMSADIDIDLGDRSKALEIIKCIPASQKDGTRHASGVYVTDIPFDAVSNQAAIDYQEADDRGYFKIDLLNVSVYQQIKDAAHYGNMLTAQPPWQRLWTDPEWSRQIVHIGNYTDLLLNMRPDSIVRMAAFISIIRPGKAHLQNRPWAEVFASVWDGDNSRGFVFKKSHAVGYAHLVMLHMNLLNQPGEPR